MKTRILSIATANPPFEITQREAKDAGRTMFRGRAALFDRLSGVFDNALIDRRAIVAPIAWYETPHGWQERTELYVRSAEALFDEVASAALAKAGLSAADIDGILFVSTTGIATPSIEARLAPRMGFRPNVRRVPVFGLGCAGGVSWNCSVEC